MQKRFLIAALAACAAFLLGALWQMSSPAERTRVRIPGRVSLDEVSDTTEPLAPIAMTEPEAPPHLEAPPSPPPVTNDPARGTIWLRVVDGETNRPLANTDCRLLATGVHEGAYVYEDDPVRGVRKTDESGLLAFTCAIARADQNGDEPEFENFEVVIRTDPLDAYRYLAPVPEGWYAERAVYYVNQDIHDLKDEPQARPIDFFVRRQASVRINVRDRYGVPVPNAGVSVSIDCHEEYDWMRAFCDVDLFNSHGDWSSHAFYFRRDVRYDRLQCKVAGATADGNRPYPAWYEEDGVTVNQFGSLAYRGLPCINIGVVAWHPLYGSASASMDLRSGSNELNVYFRDEFTAELRVRVKWLPAPPAPVDLVIQVERTGPQGLVGAIMEGDDHCARDWCFEGVVGGEQEAVISGLPPGWWHLRVDDNDWCAGHDVELAQGETRVLEVWLGENAQAQWTPVIRSGGVQLEQAGLILLGGGDSHRDEYEIWHDPESGETDALDLPPGTYTAWLPTLEPFTFTLRPGEKRVDTFELQSINVNMTLGLDLAKYLGDPEEGARLDLLPVDMWADAHGHLYALDASMREADADYDLLKPGEVKSWSLPPGEYRWQLYGGSEEVGGRVTFTGDGPTSLHFGLTGLPGYATLDVTLIGFSRDDRPVLSLEDDSQAYLAFRPEYNTEVKRVDRFETELLHDADVQRIVVSETRVLFFGPPGAMRLDVWTRENDRQFTVTLPSRITIQANEVSVHGFRKLRVLEGPTDPDAPSVIPEDVAYDTFDIELSAEGWFTRTEAGAASMHGYYKRAHVGGIVEPVPHGEFSARVVRKRRFTSNAVVIEYAEARFDRGTEDVVFELWKLSYKPGATLDLEFKGRGSPERHTDAWWFGAEGPAAPRLYALGEDGKGARLVFLEGLSEYMPDGRLEFAIRGLVLPPGSYRLVPWPGAPAKYLREFNLQPGRHTTITVSTE